MCSIAELMIFPPCTCLLLVYSYLNIYFVYILLACLIFLWSAANVISQLAPLLAL